MYILGAKLSSLFSKCKNVCGLRDLLLGYNSSCDEFNDRYNPYNKNYKTG